MTLLLNSFSLVALLVGICAEMDDPSFGVIQFCSVLIGICARWMTLLLNSFSLVPLLVGICAEMDDTSFEFI